MTRCEIEWIDGKGAPTPDQNPAVAFAVSTFINRDGSQDVRRYPCCATHATELDALVRRGPMLATNRETGETLYVSQWTREEMA